MLDHVDGDHDLQDLNLCHSGIKFLTGNYYFDNFSNTLYSGI